MADKKTESEGLGISGFTLGVLSIIFAGWLGLLIAVFGGIFCYTQQKRNKFKLAKIGLILNIIGFIVSILFIVALSFLPALADLA